MAFLAVRWLVALIRPHYQPPARQVISAFDPTAFHGIGDDALYLGHGFIDTAGNTLPDTVCLYGSGPSSDVLNRWQDCLHQTGVTSYYTEYQPGDRLETFRLIEFVIFVVLAAGLFGLTWLRMRRADAL